MASSPPTLAVSTYDVLPKEALALFPQYTGGGGGPQPFICSLVSRHTSAHKEVNRWLFVESGGMATSPFAPAALPQVVPTTADTDHHHNHQRRSSSASPAPHGNTKLLPPLMKSLTEEEADAKLKALETGIPAAGAGGSSDATTSTTTLRLYDGKKLKRSIDASKIAAVYFDNTDTVALHISGEEDLCVTFSATPSELQSHNASTRAEINTFLQEKERRFVKVLVEILDPRVPVEIVPNAKAKATALSKTKKDFGRTPASMNPMPPQLQKHIDALKQQQEEAVEAAEREAEEEERRRADQHRQLQYGKKSGVYYSMSGKSGDFSGGGRGSLRDPSRGAYNGNHDDDGDDYDEDEAAIAALKARDDEYFGYFYDAETGLAEMEEANRERSQRYGDDNEEEDYGSRGKSRRGGEGASRRQDPRAFVTSEDIDAVRDRQRRFEHEREQLFKDLEVEQKQLQTAHDHSFVPQPLVVGVDGAPHVNIMVVDGDGVGDDSSSEGSEAEMGEQSGGRRQRSKRHRKQKKSAAARAPSTNAGASSPISTELIAATSAYITAAQQQQQQYEQQQYNHNHHQHHQHQSAPTLPPLDRKQLDRLRREEDRRRQQERVDFYRGKELELQQVVSKRLELVEALRVRDEHGGAVGGAFRGGGAAITVTADGTIVPASSGEGGAVGVPPSSSFPNQTVAGDHQQQNNSTNNNLLPKVTLTDLFAADLYRPPLYADPAKEDPYYDLIKTYVGSDAATRILEPLGLYCDEGTSPQDLIKRHQHIAEFTGAPPDEVDVLLFGNHNGNNNNTNAGGGSGAQLNTTAGGINTAYYLGLGGGGAGGSTSNSPNNNKSSPHNDPHDPSSSSALSPIQKRMLAAKTSSNRHHMDYEAMQMLLSNNGGQGGLGMGVGGRRDLGDGSSAMMMMGGGAPSGSGSSLLALIAAANGQLRSASNGADNLSFGSVHNLPTNITVAYNRFCNLLLSSSSSSAAGSKGQGMAANSNRSAGGGATTMLSESRGLPYGSPLSGFGTDGGATLLTLLTRPLQKRTTAAPLSIAAAANKPTATTNALGSNAIANRPIFATSSPSSQPTTAAAAPHKLPIPNSLQDDPLLASEVDSEDIPPSDFEGDDDDADDILDAGVTPTAGTNAKTAAVGLSASALADPTPEEVAANDAVLLAEIDALLAVEFGDVNSMGAADDSADDDDATIDALVAASEAADGDIDTVVDDEDYDDILPDIAKPAAAPSGFDDADLDLDPTAADAKDTEAAMAAVLGPDDTKEEGISDEVRAEREVMREIMAEDQSDAVATVKKQLVADRQRKISEREAARAAGGGGGGGGSSNNDTNEAAAQQRQERAAARRAELKLKRREERKAAIKTQRAAESAARRAERAARASAMRADRIAQRDAKRGELLTERREMSADSG